LFFIPEGGEEEEFSFFTAATEAVGAHCRHDKRGPANKSRQERARKRREALVERRRNGSSQPGSKTVAGASMA
jgi:hypothetical protein